MASASRDRVTLDLRGMVVAQLVRRAVVIVLDLSATKAVEAGSDGQTPVQATAKMTLRLPQVHADALMLNASVLGLSHSEYVTRLLDGSRLPQPLAERQADCAALFASNDRLATLSTDLLALVTLLRQAKVEQARPYRDRLEKS